jgi:succinate dehydrogenase / fumarate reductase, cytochrome b subunit
MSSTPVASKARPQIRNIHVTQILQYKLPPPGMVSILHRVSGALLFFALPLILWLFDLSLMSELSFARLVEVGSHWFVKLVLLVLIWAFLHHLVAGIRYLLLDLHLGVEKSAARTSALAVFWISLPLTVLVALKLFGVF